MTVCRCGGDPGEGPDTEVQRHAQQPAGGPQLQ